MKKILGFVMVFDAYALALIIESLTNSGENTDRVYSSKTCQDTAVTANEFFFWPLLRLIAVKFISFHLLAGPSIDGIH